MDKNRYASDKERAQNTANIQLDFISANTVNLPFSQKDRDAIASFWNIRLNPKAEPFTPNQLSYIDSLYEKTFKKMGMPAYSTKHDNRKRW